MDNNQQSRDLGMLPMSMQQGPMEYNWKDNTSVKPAYFPSSQNTVDPVPPNIIYPDSIFKNSRQVSTDLASSSTGKYIVVKTMKRQRDVYRQPSSDSEATMSEGSETPKRRKPVSESLILPTAGTTVSSPHTPPGDLTPQLQATISTTELPTPDASFDLKHRRLGSRLSQLIPPSSTRINEIDLFKVVMQDPINQNPLYYQAEEHQSPIDNSAKAQNYIDLAHAHQKVQDLHSAETDFLRAFQMYNRSKGPQSPEVMRTMSEMAGIYEDQSRPAEAPRRRRNCYVFCG